MFLKLHQRGSAFVIASYIAHQNGDGYSVRKDLALMMVAIWGIRLSIHIGISISLD